jgi:hypothetical protein
VSLTPSQAARHLIDHGHVTPCSGKDDPLEASFPLRWWWDEDGVLCRAWWRGAVSRFEDITLVERGRQASA